MRDQVVPNLPLIANTFYPPNQPSAKRLYRFGEMVGEVIDKWDRDLRVAVIGSGGMSHFCIDEELDKLRGAPPEPREVTRAINRPTEFWL